MLCCISLRISTRYSRQSEYTSFSHKDSKDKDSKDDFSFHMDKHAVLKFYVGLIITMSFFYFFFVLSLVLLIFPGIYN